MDMEKLSKITIIFDLDVVIFIWVLIKEYLQKKAPLRECPLFRGHRNHA